MKIKHTLIAVSAVALLSGGAIAATQADYEKAAASAMAAQKAAGAAKGEWRDTGKMLKKAAAAAKKGDYAKATKIAQAAEFQGKMAEQQAKEQMNAGNAAYLYQ